MENPHRDLPRALSRLLTRVGLALAFAGAVLFGYFMFFYPVDADAKRELGWRVAAALLAFGALDLFLMALYLLPVRVAVGELAHGKSPSPQLIERAHKAASRFHQLGAIQTLGCWLLGIPLIAITSSGSAIPSDILLAGTLTGLCTGGVSAMLVYYIAVGDLYAVRAALAGPEGTVAKGGTIGQRILSVAVTVLVTGVAMIGSTAYVHHRSSMETEAIATCEKVLSTLAELEVSKQQLAQAAADACGGSATVASSNRVLAQAGPDRVTEADVGRRAGSTVLSMPHRSGVTLYAQVGDRAQVAARKAFAADIFGFAAMAMLLAMLVAFVAARAITTPVRNLTEGAEAVADGDLTRNVPVLTADEIGVLANTFTAMSTRLRGLVRNISAAASSMNNEVSTVAKVGTRVQHGLEVRREGVAGATREMTDMDASVASVGRDVSGLSEYVAGTGAALAELAAALDEVRRQGAELDHAVKDARSEVQGLLRAADTTRKEIGAVAEAAKTTLTTVADARQSLGALTEAANEGDRTAERVFSETESGKRVVDEGVRGVEAIRGVVTEAKARVAALGARGEDITEIVDFIAEVAGRTNLLSLNAAIIAAQAGEQGKPFGVVAEQIRALASQIGSSTKRIDDIIAGLRVEVDATSALIQQSDELASVGVERARESWHALSRIAEATKRSRDVNASILPAVQAHAMSTQQIEHLAGRVVELAEGFQGATLLTRAGKSIESIAQSLAPLTHRVGQALDEQARMGRKQLESLEEINRMIARLNRTVSQHGEGTARVLKNLSELVAMADDDTAAATQLADAAKTLERHAAALRDGLGRFRV